MMTDTMKGNPEESARSPIGVGSELLMGVTKLSRKDESRRGVMKIKNSGAYVKDIPKGVRN